LQLKRLKSNMRAAMESRPRWIVVALALISAFSFALAVQSAWWTAGEVAIGPFGARHCFGGECRESGLAWIGGSELWMRSAIATRAAGYIAMFVLIAFAGGIAAKREPRLVSRAALASIVTAIATGVYFFAAFPGVDSASLGRGPFCYAAGVIFGVAAVVMFLRSLRR
jgi:hypothetical protein